MASMSIRPEHRSGAAGQGWVSDAVTLAGSKLSQFTLNGPRVTRKDGRLPLEDGTLAGADLDLDHAVRVIVGEVGIPLEQALARAASDPAAVIGQGGRVGQ